MNWKKIKNIWERGGTWYKDMRLLLKGVNGFRNFEFKEITFINVINC